MTKVLISVLLAATAAFPALAEGRDERGGGNWNRPAAPQQQRAQPAPAPQASPPQASAPQIFRQGGGNWQGGNGTNWRGNPANIQAQPRPQQQPQQFAAPQGRADGRGFFRGQQTPPNAPLPNGQTFVAPQPQQGHLGFQGRPNGQGFVQNDDRRGGDGQWSRGSNGHWEHDGDRHFENHDRGDQGRFSRGWRNDNRYNWQAYRDYNRGFYHLDHYFNPYGYGYGYQPFGIGVYLDSPFFSSNYWINDPYSYRLPPAYGNTRWVRYYNDVVLIDIDTGEVLDVIHNFFW